MKPSAHFLNPAVARIALSTALMVTSFSMFSPVLAVMLQQRGHGTAVVGAFAMIGFACIAVLIPSMPKILARLGEVRACRIGTTLQFVATLGYANFDDLTIWCGCAVLGGIGAAAVWNGTEALIARYSAPDRRGRITGLYQTVLGAGMTLGPFAPKVFGLTGPQTLMLACAVQAVGLLLVLTANLEAAAPAEPGTSAEPGTPAEHSAPMANPVLTTWAAFKHVPALAAMAFAGGVFEGGLGSVSAANGAALGLSMAAAVSIVGALGAGSFLFQLPAGLLADRAHPPKVFAAAGVLLLMGSLALGLSGAAPWLLWLCAFVWGGVGGALYTLSMIRVAHQFAGQDTAAGAAAMITGYTLGGAMGPVVSGASLQALGVVGTALWLSLLSLGVIWFARRVT